MPAVCFYFQAHQPFRLKPYDFTHIGYDHLYENDLLNQDIFNKVARNCYLPTNKLMLELIEKYPDSFKITFSISGTLLEQMQLYSSEVLESFKELIASGNVEVLGETHYHSLAALYDKEEFKEQVLKHKETLKELFGVEPTIFRNTELITDDSLFEVVADLGFKAILAEKPNDNDGEVSTIYRSENGLPILLRNTPLSDDIAFRFSDPNWDEYPMLAPDFAKKLAKYEKDDFVGLFMDYETFGEHRKVETGIFDFMKWLPHDALALQDLSFVTPTEALFGLEVSQLPIMRFPKPSSWAGKDKDISSWRENSIQFDSLEKVYALKNKVFEKNSPDFTHLWRKLQTSDHFYYMSTLYRNDPVHQVFSHYTSPFDAYINYMNVLSDFEKTL